jgi:hypothetical protein
MKSYAVFVLALVALPSIALAQQTGPGTRERIRVDVNFLWQHSAQRNQTYSATVVPFPGASPAATTTNYPAFSSTFGAGIDGGIVLHGGFGVGIHFDRSAYDGSVALDASVPHPVVPSGPVASDSSFIETAKTRETAVDISGSYVIRLAERWQLRVFAGPSYLTVTQSMLNHYSYSQQFDFAGLMNTMQIEDTSLRTEEVVASGWGGHAGADVQYFFNRYLGVGAVMRINRGTVSITEPLTHASSDLRVGHVSAGGGLRIRF